MGYGLAEPLGVSGAKDMLRILRNIEASSLAERAATRAVTREEAKKKPPILRPEAAPSGTPPSREERLHSTPRAVS